MKIENDFQSVIEKTKTHTPQLWNAIKVNFYYDFDAMRLNFESKEAEGKNWTHFNHDHMFEVMDNLQALAEKSHLEQNDPWTKLTLIINADGSYQHEFGYGDPKMFDLSTH